VVEHFVPLLTLDRWAIKNLLVVFTIVHSFPPLFLPWPLPDADKELHSFLSLFLATEVSHYWTSKYTLYSKKQKTYLGLTFDRHSQDLIANQSCLLTNDSLEIISRSEGVVSLCTHLLISLALALLEERLSLWLSARGSYLKWCPTAKHSNQRWIKRRYRCDKEAIAGVNTLPLHSSEREYLSDGVGRAMAAFSSSSFLMLIGWPLSNK